MRIRTLLHNKNLQFFLCFGGILFTDAYLSHLGLDQWRYLTKPLILLSLIGYFMSYRKQLSATLFKFGLAALILSLAGDVFLMFSSQIPALFIAGLGAFLLAHVFYIFIFVKQRNSALPVPWLKLIKLLSYAFIMGFLVLENTGDLRIPVLLYIAVITSMAFTSLLRKGAVVTHSYAFGLIGARFFLASDSLLALSMFRDNFPDVGFLVMLTYGVAQAMIAYSLVCSEKKVLSKLSV